MLCLGRKYGERVFIGDEIRITVVRLTVHEVRLAIEAPRELAIFREEIAPWDHPLMTANDRPPLERRP